MEDVQIIDLYWLRDERAIGETDAKYGSFCHRIAMNILHSFQDSEECVSDAYGRCWDTMPPQRPGSLRAYLGTIIRNLSISRYRSAHAQKRFGGVEVLLSGPWRPWSWGSSSAGGWRASRRRTAPSSSAATGTATR